MKKIVAGFACLLVLVMGYITTFAGGSLAVSVDALNVRGGAGTAYPVLGRLARGETVDAVSYSNGWFRINFDGSSSAFVSAEFVTPESLSAVVTASGVNIRAGASLNDAVVGRATSGMALRVYGMANGFYQIIHNNSIAFIHSDFVDITMMDAFAGEFVGGGVRGTVASANVNIRAGASTATAIVGRTFANQHFTVFGINGNFYRVGYGDGFAYIHSDFVSGAMLGFLIAQNHDIELPAISVPLAAPPPPAAAAAASPMYATVNVSRGLNFREQPSTDARIISTLTNNTHVYLIERGEHWHRVLHNGATGYISAEFATVHYGEMPDNTLRGRIVDFSRQFIGVRYVWGGTSLTTGVDCSGFTQAIFRNFGIQLNRVSRDQISNGTRLTRNQLRAGDLVFFSYNQPGTIQHVGIYIGGGQFIHSSSGRANGVVITGMDSAWHSARFIAGADVIGN